MMEPTEVRTVPAKMPTVTIGFAVTRPPIRAVPRTELNGGYEIRDNFQYALFYIYLPTVDVR